MPSIVAFRDPASERALMDYWGEWMTTLSCFPCDHASWMPQGSKAHSPLFVRKVGVGSWLFPFWGDL